MWYKNTFYFNCLDIKWLVQSFYAISNLWLHSLGSYSTVTLSHCSSRIWFKSSDKSMEPSSEENIVFPGKAGSRDEGTKLRTSPLTGLHTNKTHTAINMQRCFHFTTPTGVLKKHHVTRDTALRVQPRHTLKKTHCVSSATIILLQTWRNENKW